MAIDIRVIEMSDGSNQSRSDRLLAGLQLAVANLSGATSAAVTTAVAFVAGALPATYAVFVDPGQAGVFASVSGKTINGFNVVLTPLSSAAVAAGTFSVLIVG
jgi:hypothetical protein